MSIDFAPWKAATGALAPLQQQAFLDVLNLVAEGKSHLAYGADYVDGKPCLVNHVGHMLKVGGGHGVPSANFGAMVGEFDRVNRALRDIKINENDGFVAPLAAEILIKNFGDLKPVKADDAQWEAAREQVTGTPAGPYVEPTDDEFASYLLTMATDANESEPIVDEVVNVLRNSQT